MEIPKDADTQLRKIAEHSPDKVAAFFTISDAQKYLWQSYAVDYGSGDTPREIVDACNILTASESTLRRELIGIMKQDADYLRG